MFIYILSFRIINEHCSQYLNVLTEKEEKANAPIVYYIATKKSCRTNCMVSMAAFIVDKQNTTTTSAWHKHGLCS